MVGGLGVLGGLGARRAWGFGEGERLQLGQVIYGNTGGSTGVPRPNAIKRLMWEIEKRTSIEVMLDAAPVRLGAGGGAELSRHPILYWAGDRAFPLPSDEEIGRLRRHLLLGGMLLLDSAEGRAGGGFDQSARALCARLFPRGAAGGGGAGGAASSASANGGLLRLPEDHVLFRSFYLLRTPVGRVIAQPFLEAVQHDGRAVILYSQNDLGGAWARDSYGQWEYDVVPGGDAQREQAFRLGVNLAMYALCLDYKTDQVHVPFIMRRRPWQLPPPGAGPAGPGSSEGKP